MLQFGKCLSVPELMARTSKEQGAAPALLGLSWLSSRSSCHDNPLWTWHQLVFVISVPTSGLDLPRDPRSLPHPVFPPGSTTPAQINSSVSIAVLGVGFGFGFSSFAVADVENLSSSSLAVAQHLAVCVVVQNTWHISPALAAASAPGACCVPPSASCTASQALELLSLGRFWCCSERAAKASTRQIPLSVMTLRP